MANILDQIIENKRSEVAIRKSAISLEQLKKQIASTPPCRDFYTAVSKPNKRGLNVIAEVKRASPSAGVIRKDFDAVEIARTYQSCGADAISVLTDEKYFQGRLEYIERIKQAVALPILRKDFIIDPWQIYEARAAGADAILLIARVLSTDELSSLMQTADKLGLAVLLEAHESEMLLKVRDFVGNNKKHRCVIGINNRNLNTMKVDFNTTERLAKLVKNSRELVAESGINERADVERLISLGVGAVLIGRALCASGDIYKKFAELFG